MIDAGDHRMPRPACHRASCARLALPLAALLGLAGCASNAPPQERGFFGALGAAASGSDVARDRQMQADAAAAEQRAAEMQARLAGAQQQAAASGQRVTQAEARLRQVNTEIARLRQRAAALPTDGQTPAQREEADRLRREAEALERERRAAAEAPGGPTDAAVESLRRRAGALEDALNRQQRL
jgi:TolA-binding protein